MNIVDLKEALYDIVSGFFDAEKVFWAEQVMTKPEPPYVTLKLGTLQRTAFPVENETWERCYHCTVPLELNLYTNGKEIDSTGNVTKNYINTAVSDMLEFANYAESERITDNTLINNLSIALMGNIRDLTSLENDTQHRYRAMAEFEIAFVDNASGEYGTSAMITVPNASGGGSAAMTAETGELIETVEIKHKKEEENEDEE